MFRNMPSCFMSNVQYFSSKYEFDNLCFVCRMASYFLIPIYNIFFFVIYLCTFQYQLISRSVAARQQQMQKIVPNFTPPSLCFIIAGRHSAFNDFTKSLGTPSVISVHKLKTSSQRKLPNK